MQTTRSHTSCCHHCQYCRVDFVVFNNVTCCTNFLLSCVHVDTKYFLIIMWTLVVTCMMLGRLECSRIVGLLKHPHGAKYEPPWLFRQGSKVVDTKYHLTPTCVDGISAIDH
jgi:hypothetical protein